MANHVSKASMANRHGAASSNVGSGQLYVDGDQRVDSQAEIRERERYKEGQTGSHMANDSSSSTHVLFKDDRSIANRLAREEQRARKGEQDQPVDREAELSKKDPTLPAKNHGNKPSKGAQIDAELKAEDEQRLREKRGK
ncbi:hypothetical protein BGW36DRAFT_360236 [Talaromyces proteolyticus]|uniref:Uncharacterized protein n=1 Tax=Talaromyces proteolyticus TaxID=1131652 RepID=A0AAD4PZZ9_9EURO|nr:uncharacterized protein BGW36DRAFT_360236 [Talaromyces proteolyticus]KAH8696398.1 hypothetical protein BGW36DRAFT_360236 [Talaromyces proteolyticus]